MLKPLFWLRWEITYIGPRFRTARPLQSVPTPELSSITRQIECGQQEEIEMPFQLFATHPV
jgi:hypothetical protein